MQEDSKWIDEILNEENSIENSVEFLTLKFIRSKVEDILDENVELYSVFYNKEVFYDTEGETGKKIPVQDFGVDVIVSGQYHWFLYCHWDFNNECISYFTHVEEDEFKYLANNRILRTPERDMFLDELEGIQDMIQNNKK